MFIEYEILTPFKSEEMPQSTEDARPVITPAAENPSGGVFQNAHNFSIQGANFTSYARDVIHHHHTGMFICDQASSEYILTGPSGSVETKKVHSKVIST